MITSICNTNNQFIINNDNDEFIIITNMNNTFKLYYNKELWQEFTNLYYDKMVGLVSFFNLSNSKNLYNHINCNNNLEFKNPNIFEDIKIIIKRHLNNQLQYWGKNKNFVNSTIDLTSNDIIDIFPSFTLETNLEQRELFDTKEINININDNKVKNLLLDTEIKFADFNLNDDITPLLSNDSLLTKQEKYLFVEGEFDSDYDIINNTSIDL